MCALKMKAKKSKLDGLYTCKTYLLNTSAFHDVSDVTSLLPFTDVMLCFIYLL
jgi:hypothetical protein